MKESAVEFYVSNIKKYEEQFNKSEISIKVLEATRTLWLEKAKEIEGQQKDEYAVLFTEFLNQIKFSDNQTYYNNTLGELLVIFKNN